MEFSEEVIGNIEYALEFAGDRVVSWVHAAGVDYSPIQSNTVLLKLNQLCSVVSEEPVPISGKACVELNCRHLVGPEDLVDRSHSGVFLNFSVLILYLLPEQSRVCTCKT